MVKNNKTKTMMKKIVLAFILFFILESSSCKKLCEDDKIFLSKKENTSNRLKLDGYYYWYDTDGLLIFDFFLYENGILFRVTGSEETCEDYEKKILTSENIEQHYRHKKKFWGVYLIEDSVIKYELYYPGSSCSMSTWVMEGIILNDTTFHIQKSYKPDGSDLNVENKTYHFKQFSPKPDSINPYIK